MQRVIAWSATVVVAGALGVGGWLLHGTLVVGVGYKAKMLCSGVFVSRLDPQAVIAGLQVDDLGALRYIDASIDRSTRSASAAALLGAITRRAVYREGLGCALVLDGLDPPALPGNPSAHDAFDVHRSQPSGVEGRQPDGTRDDSRRTLHAAVSRAFAEPDPQHKRRTLAVVVMQYGQILAEQYAPGIHPTTPLPGWSMTKSVMNALTGILVRDHVLATDQSAPVPEWQHAGDPRAPITLDQLLRMSSGLRFDEGMVSPRSDVMQMLFSAGDVAAFAANKPLARPPGARWEYSSGTSNILALVIRNALRDELAYLRFPRRALFDRIGMSSAVLETDAAGIFVGSSYMYATARDWALFGTLYLQDGVWNGARILPEGWVAYTTSPAPADATRHYGAQFWLQVPAEYAGRGAQLPVPAFHAVGHEAQFVTIVPSRGVVIVRLGRTRYPEAWDHPAFVRDVLAALATIPAPA